MGVVESGKKLFLTWPKPTNDAAKTAITTATEIQRCRMEADRNHRYMR